MTETTTRYITQVALLDGLTARRVETIPTALVKPLLHRNGTDDLGVRRPAMAESLAKGGDIHAYEIEIRYEVRADTLNCWRSVSARAVLASETGPSEVWQWYACDADSVLATGYGERQAEALGAAIVAILNGAGAPSLPIPIDGFDGLHNCPF